MSEIYLTKIWQYLRLKVWTLCIARLQSFTKVTTWSFLLCQCKSVGQTWKRTQLLHRKYTPLNTKTVYVQSKTIRTEGIYFRLLNLTSQFHFFLKSLTLHYDNLIVKKQETLSKIDTENTHVDILSLSTYESIVNNLNMLIM